MGMLNWRKRNIPVETRGTAELQARGEDETSEGRGHIEQSIAASTIIAKADAAVSSTVERSLLYR